MKPEHFVWMTAVYYYAMRVHSNIWFKPQNDMQIVYDLNTPEGVTAIPSEMFKEYVVHMQITFPKSPHCTGGGCGRGSAFRYSWLPDLVLPEAKEAYKVQWHRV